ncbi:MAG: 3-dehydroquinate synthase II [Archaeoglobales archaeon]|nr:3-dehydroquinate synthase II [Archaeoglobales archaeon]
MKEIWVIAEGSWEESKEILRNAIELGFDGAFVKREYVEKARKLGRIDVEVLEDSLVEIKSAEDQKLAMEKSLALVKFVDWKIIPLENIIAMKKGKVIAAVNSEDEVKTILTTLEKGADGIAVKGDREELKNYFKIVKETSKRIELKKAKIKEVRTLGVGERVCIDTVTLMSVGEGALVGNQANFMFLVASESEESEYVASRPFRINAGSVNAYVKIGEKTKYLAELKAGDEIEIVRYDGSLRRSFVGRVKIERRPLILLRAECDGFEGSIILQNAETIKLVNPAGKHLSVSQLKAGDEVLVWIGDKARHFGVSIDEFVVER